MKNILIIIFIVVLFGGLAWYLSTSKESSVLDEEITSFEECVAAGNTILESYPRECRTPDGETFIEETEQDFNLEQSCVDSGGTVEEGMCCLTTTDFPNLCLIGACGCSPENSQEIKICNCGEGKCFNGSECVVVQ